MSKSGQSNYKGINAQVWAAMSLFLQYLRYADFSYIQLEAPEFEDFNLVFNDGHKIICESKDWKQEFGYSNLKKILSNILKKVTIGKKDEILIICTELNDDLRSRVEHMKYGSQFLAPEFKKKGFSNQQISVLDRVKFWKVQQEDNHLIVYALFSELLDFWLPEDELECKTDSILIKRIYEGSAKGKVYKREDIISEIDSMRKKASKYSGYFDDERVKIEMQLQNLIKAIKNNKAPEWASNQLSAISSKPSLMFFVVDLLSNKRIDDLRKWNDLWEMYKIYRFSFSLYKIFENNLHTEKNQNYILDFFEDNIGKIKRYYQHDFFDIDVVKIVSKILESNRKEYPEKSFKIIEKLIANKKKDMFYLKIQKDSSWELEETAKLLLDIYQKSDSNLKKKIYLFIIDNFNLIKDEGEFDHYTPKGIFEILKIWISDDFEKKFPRFVKELINQYIKFYEKFGNKLGFNGWEHMGGGISFSGSYHISDRHFVGYVLIPAINKFYKQNEKEAWEFIKKHCITKTENVSVGSPDFLNRAVYSIVLERYKNKDKKVSDEAFKILKEFILSRKGIPHKSDLIYQALIGFDISDDKKMNLVRVSINVYKTPINVFVEQIVSNLIKNKNEEAKKILASWFDNPKYYERVRFDSNIIQNIKDAIETDFDFGISLFNSFVNSEFFINEYDSFDVYEFAKILHDILVKKFEVGMKISIDIMKRKKLSKNQQILLCHSLLQKSDNHNKDKKEDLIKIYDEFINPLLKFWDNDINTINKIIWHGNAREAFVQFAERLAINKKIEKALRIVNVFINDPDPFLPGKDPEDKEDIYNEHKRIENGGKSHENY